LLNSNPDRRKKMNETVDILKINEEIARKFRKIEESLPSSCTIKDLFEKLLIQIEEEFHIPFVWISILNEGNVIDVIKVFKASKILKDRINILDRKVFLDLVAEGTMPKLINDNLKPFYKLLPRNKKYFIKSLAVAPMTLNSEIIGSMNYGDFSSLRYQPGMDTTLLEKLAFNVSARLSAIKAGEDDICNETIK
jgi:uncharacterized protein YigA (DUF484 family)